MIYLAWIFGLTAIAFMSMWMVTNAKVRSRTQKEISKLLDSIDANILGANKNVELATKRLNETKRIIKDIQDAVDQKKDDTTIREMMNAWKFPEFPDFPDISWPQWSTITTYQPIKDKEPQPAGGENPAGIHKKASPIEKKPTWNYRLIAYDTTHHTAAGKVIDPYMAIHEVFYDGSGRITKWTEDPVTFGGETSAEVASALQMAMNDCIRHKTLSLAKLNAVTAFPINPSEVIK